MGWDGLQLLLESVSNFVLRGQEHTEVLALLKTLSVAHHLQKLRCSGTQERKVGEILTDIDSSRQTVTQSADYKHIPKPFRLHYTDRLQTGFVQVTCSYADILNI